jgi:hypothetical protein
MRVIWHEAEAYHPFRVVRTRAAVDWFNNQRFEDPNNGPIMQVSVAERKAWDGGRGGGGGGRGGIFFFPNFAVAGLVFSFLILPLVRYKVQRCVPRYPLHVHIVVPSRSICFMMPALSLENRRKQRVRSAFFFFPSAFTFI